MIAGRVETAHTLGPKDARDVMRRLPKALAGGASTGMRRAGTAP